MKGVHCQTSTMMTVSRARKLLVSQGTGSSPAATMA